MSFCWSNDQSTFGGYPSSFIVYIYIFKPGSSHKWTHGKMGKTLAILKNILPIAFCLLNIFLEKASKSSISSSRLSSSLTTRVFLPESSTFYLPQIEEITAEEISMYKLRGNIRFSRLYISIYLHASLYIIYCKLQKTFWQKAKFKIP